MNKESLNAWGRKLAGVLEKYKFLFLILLAGVVDPDFKNTALQEKYGAATPAELVEKLLLPGEIEDLAREIEKLSGYRTVTLEEIKKKSTPETPN